MRFTVANLNDVLTYGPYAWPGGYPVYFIAADGEALSFKAVKENQALVTEAMNNSGTDKQWEVIGYQINWEDENLYCAHSNDLIECAYPSDKEDT